MGVFAHTRCLPALGARLPSQPMRRRPALYVQELLTAAVERLRTAKCSLVPAQTKVRGKREKEKRPRKAISGRRLSLRPDEAEAGLCGARNQTPPCENDGTQRSTGRTDHARGRRTAGRGRAVLGWGAPSRSLAAPGLRLSAAACSAALAHPTAGFDGRRSVGSAARVACPRGARAMCVPAADARALARLHGDRSRGGAGDGAGGLPQHRRVSQQLHCGQAEASGQRWS